MMTHFIKNINICNRSTNGIGPKWQILLVLLFVAMMLYCYMMHFYFPKVDSSDKRYDENERDNEYKRKNENNNNNTKTLEGLVIVTNHYNEDLSWLLERTEKSKYDFESVPIVVCSKSGRFDSPRCPAGPNKGREASGYLNYIVTNYHDLPDHVAFIHGHQYSYHQTYSDLLGVIACARYRTHGFVSLNHRFIDDRSADSEPMVRLRRMWSEHFEPYLRRPPPTYVLHDCCAQFIVSRDRILALPRQAYQHWHDLFMADTDGDGGFRLGFVFEYIWHVIFGEPDVVTEMEHADRFDAGCLAALGRKEG
jgi:Protein of unknown function (DUF3431)